MDMEVSSDSSDTIIMPFCEPSSNDVKEPSDAEVENILKKYSSPSVCAEFKESTSSQGDFAGEALIDVSLNKKRKKDGNDDYIATSAVQIYDCESIQNKYSLQDCPNDNLKKVSMNKSKYEEYLDTDSEEILKELKYIPSTSKSNNDITDLIVLSDDSGTTELKNDGFPRSHQVRGRRKRRSKQICTNNSSESETEAELSKSAAKLKRQRDVAKKKQEKAQEKARKQEEAEKKRAMKNMEKQKQKEEAERQKAMKNALKTVQQSTKPDECMKHMIVELAPEVSEKNYAEILKATLKTNGISFKSTPQAAPNLVSWRRNVQTLEDMVLKNTELNESHFLLIMEKPEFLLHIRKDSLTVHLQSISSVIKFKTLTVAVLGIDKVTGDQDVAVTEAQLLFKCYFRYVKQPDDLATLVLEVTKAIAQIPHKAKKEEQHKLQTEYFNDSNKDTVKVDKNGNGLGRLWQQMLTMFPLARLETSEAITAVYPTPDSLFKAYESCQSKKEELLQDLPIRRALGPCISVRRIGPELSRKCSTFFCSTDNVLL